MTTKIATRILSVALIAVFSFVTTRSNAQTYYNVPSSSAVYIDPGYPAVQYQPVELTPANGTVHGTPFATTPRLQHQANLGGVDSSVKFRSDVNPGHVAYNVQMSNNGNTQSHTLEAGVMRNPQSLGEVFERRDPHSSTQYLAGARYHGTGTTASGIQIQNTVGAGLVADYDSSLGVSYDPSKGETFYGAKAGARMGGQVEASSRQDWGSVGSVPVSSETTGTVFVGAEAEGRAGITASKNQVAAGVGAEAFVGAKATASQSVTAGAVGGTVTGEAWAGAGVDIGADVTYKNGVIGWETDAKAGLGVGGGIGVDGTVDVGQVYQSGQAKYQAVDRWVDQRGQQVQQWSYQQGQTLNNGVNQAWQQQQNAANQTWNQTRNIANQTWQQQQNVTNQASNHARNFANQTANQARNVSNNVKSSTKRVTNKVGSSAKKAGNKIKGLFK